MSFLKKFGQISMGIGKVAAEIVGFAPVAERMFPKEAGLIQVISQDLSQVASIVQDVEVVGQALNLPGAQKLVAASPLVAQVILKSSVLANRKIANPTLFKQGATKIGDGMADILNSLDDDIVTADKV